MEKTVSMRIAYFADNFYPELSGIVDSLLITANELKRRGHEIVFVGPRYALKDYAVARRDYIIEHGREHFDGMPILRLPSVPLPNSPTGQSRIGFPTGATFAYFDQCPPDIVHTNSPYGAGLEAVRVSKRYKVPLVGTNHTPVEEFYPWAPRLAKRLDALYYNRCAFVSTPYAGLLEAMRKSGFKRAGEAIPNPVELPLFRPPHAADKEQIKKEMGYKGPVVLYCGRLGEEKHNDVTLRAVARLVPEFPDITFTMTGHGMAEKSLRKLAKELGIEKNVRFTGFVSMQELPKHYQAADVFVIMSTADSQSIALMQGFASGLPAIAARARGLVDYVPAQCGFLVEPGDDRKVAEHIRQLLLDMPLSERLGKAGVQFVKKFSPEAIGNEWEKIFRRAIEEHVREGAKVFKPEAA